MTLQQVCCKRGGRTPPQILAEQKAPPGSGGVPHYYLPPQIFRPCNIPVQFLPIFKHHCIDRQNIFLFSSFLRHGNLNWVLPESEVPESDIQISFLVFTLTQNPFRRWLLSTYRDLCQYFHSVTDSRVRDRYKIDVSIPLAHRFSCSTQPWSYYFLDIILEACLFQLLWLLQ